MSQDNDKTGGASSGARRQAKYAERQRASGRRQRSYWLTDEEAAAIADFLEDMRKREAPYTCKYCGLPSWIDPSEQCPPSDYCHDHGEPEP